MKPFYSLSIWSGSLKYDWKNKVRSYEAIMELVRVAQVKY